MLGDFIKVEVNAMQIQATETINETYTELVSYKKVN